MNNIEHELLFRKYLLNSKVVRELIIPKWLTEETEKKEKRSNNYEEMKKIYEAIRDAFNREINNKGVKQ